MLALTLFCDGAARRNPRGPAGAGAVLLDETGNEVQALRRFLGVRTNNEAEYEALLLGLERALALGARRMSIRADSEVMVNHLNRTYRVKAANLRPLYERAIKLLAQFEVWDARHVRREQNGRADALANEAIDREQR